MLTPSALLIACSIVQAAPEVVVVRPAAWESDLAPWVQLREAEGWRVESHKTPRDAAELHNLISRRAAAGAKYVVLVGDASPDAGAGACPTKFASVSASLAYGGRPTAASDAALADGDGDDLPDLVVARWPFSSSQTLRRYVQRIVARGRQSSEGDWRGRIAVAAAPGGFGPLLDAVIENSARELLSNCIPADRRLDVLYARPGGSACPELDRIPEQVHAQFARGCQFWLYVGHGSPDRLAPLLLRQGRYPVFETRHAEALPAGSERSIAVLLTCLAGDHAGPRRCLAEAMLAAEHGPVAALAGSAVTMPYGMAVFGYELTRTALDGEAATVGEAVHQARRNLAADRRDAMRMNLDALYSAAGSSAAARAVERRDHALLFHLFGDPLIPVERPTRLSIDGPLEASAGEPVQLHCRCDFAERPASNSVLLGRGSRNGGRLQALKARIRPPTATLLQSLLPRRPATPRSLYRCRSLPTPRATT